MEKILIVVVAAAALLIGSQASASQTSGAEVEKTRPTVVAPMVDQIAARRGPGILRRLMEVERRKNAWLRRTLLRG